MEQSLSRFDTAAATYPALTGEYRMKLNNRQLFCVTLIVFVFLAVIARAWNDQVRAFHLTARQNPTENFLARSAALCQTLAPQAATIQMTQDIELDDQTIRYIRCTDGQGRRLAHFVWDGETGDLLLCTTLEGARPAEGTNAPMDRAEAEKRARFWLQSLGVSSQASQWQLTGSLERAPRAWVARLRGEGKQAHIILNAKTGGLNVLQSKPETMVFTGRRFASMSANP
jgi:hypothetical protein